MSSGPVVAMVVMSFIVMLPVVVMFFVVVISVIAGTAVITLLGAVSVAASFSVVFGGYVEDAKGKGEDEDKH